MKELLRSLGMRLWLCVFASGAQEKPAFSVSAPRRSSCSANSIIQVTCSICCAQDRWRTILRKIQSSTSVVLPPLDKHLAYLGNTGSSASPRGWIVPQHAVVLHTDRGTQNHVHFDWIIVEWVPCVTILISALRHVAGSASPRCRVELRVDSDP